MLEGRKPYPKLNTIAFGFGGKPVYTESGKQIPEWMKKYDVQPHEKKHGEQFWKTFFPLLVASPEKKREIIARMEIEAYNVSIASLEKYLAELERKK